MTLKAMTYSELLQAEYKRLLTSLDGSMGHTGSWVSI